MASQTGDPSSTMPPPKSFLAVVKSSTRFRNLDEAVKFLKDKENTSQANEDTKNFCATAVYDPDWRLKLNLPTKVIKIQASQMNSFKKLKSISHKNLLPVLDVSHQTANEATITCPLLRNLEDFCWSRTQAYYCCNGQINTFSFRYLISSLIEGVVELHSHGMIHGSIQMSNVFVSDGVTQPLYRLGNYALDCLQIELEQKKRKDFADLGCFIKTMMTKIDSGRNSQNRLVSGHHEFNDLASFLLNGKCKSNQFKFLIYYHPAFMTSSEKANFSIQAYEYLCKVNKGPQLDREMFSDDWFNRMPVDLRKLLIEKEATSFEFDSNHHAVIVGGLVNFFRTLKNCLKHHKAHLKEIQHRNLVINYPDGRGNSKFDSWVSIIDYFIALQPTSIVSLWRFIAVDGFYYSSRILLKELNDPVLIDYHGDLGCSSHSSLMTWPQ